MKAKILLPAIIVTCVAIQSCNKIASNLQYDLSMQTGSVDIAIPPLSDTTANIGMGVIGSTYNIDSFIKSKTGNVLGINSITSAKMSSCVLTILNPDDSNNFANFQNSNVTFYTNTNTTPFSAAVITNNPDTYAATLNVPVDATTEMKSYLRGSQLTYSLSGKIRRKTTDTVICNMQFTINVHVQG